MNWAAEEFATLYLGDKRLNKRLVTAAQQWADKSTHSIPGASRTCSHFSGGSVQ